MKVELTVAPPQTQVDLLGLIVPIPPQTSNQIFESVNFYSGFEISELSEQVSGQKGYLLKGDFSNDFKISFLFSLQESIENNDIFVDFPNVYTTLQSSFTEFLDISPSHITPTTIVRAVQKRFTYGPRNYDLSTPAEFDGVGSGNCIDINTILLACLRQSDICVAYQAGYFFPSNSAGLTSDGMHCWITTRKDYVEEDWDIAHCLQAGIEEAIPHLNPKGGLRVAFSYGRGLVFENQSLVLKPISHFARPHWVSNNGSTREANITAKLTDPADIAVGT